MNRKTGQIYTPAKSARYEEAIAWASKRCTPMEKGKPVKVTMDFYCTPRPRQQMMDTDNGIKAVLDGLVKGGTLSDDVDVIAIEAYRWEDNNSRTEVTLEYV